MKLKTQTENHGFFLYYLDALETPKLGNIIL
jgi:hypothetical protein